MNSIFLGSNRRTGTDVERPRSNRENHLFIGCRKEVKKIGWDQHINLTCFMFNESGLCHSMKSQSERRVSSPWRRSGLRSASSFSSIMYTLLSLEANGAKARPQRRKRLLR